LDREAGPYRHTTEHEAWHGRVMVTVRGRRIPWPVSRVYVL